MADPEIPEVRAELLREDAPKARPKPRDEPIQRSAPETPEEAAARRAMPPYEPEPAVQDNPSPPLNPTLTDPLAAQIPAKSSFVWLGGLLTALGLLAIVFPFVSTLATTLFIGGVLLAAGVFKLFSAFRTATNVLSGALKGAWGLLYLIGGGLILYALGAGAWSLTLVLAVLFILGGIASIAWALAPPHRHGKGWMVASGLLSVLLGALVGMGAPTTALWFPGVVAGVDLLSTGLAFLFMDRAARTALAQTGQLAS